MGSVDHSSWSIFTVCFLLVWWGPPPGHALTSITPSSSSASSSSIEGRPIAASGWPHKFPAKEHCSRCGLCESSYVSYVQQACSFLPNGMMVKQQRQTVDDNNGGGGDWEARVHGRGRDLKHNQPDIAEELRFGVLAEPVLLARGTNLSQNPVQTSEESSTAAAKPQWTGVVSAIAESMLEQGMVQAVVCIGAATSATNDNNDDISTQQERDATPPLDWATPEPLVAYTVEDVRRGRGVKPSLAPTLRVLDELKNAPPNIQSILVCGVGCAVQAFRAVEGQLRLDNPALTDIYVLGTNCADNSPTPQAAKNFVQKGILQGETASSSPSIQGYEFMADFKIHVKTDQGYRKMPYFCLSPSLAAPSIAPSCLACFDYTNALADVVVGYMGAPTADRMDNSWQTLTIRNTERGRRMVDAAVDSGRLILGDVARSHGRSSHAAFAMSTVQSDTIVQELQGKTLNPDQTGVPLWFGNILARVLQTVGPKGVGFARYSIDYHILRNYLHVLSCWGPDQVEARVPQYARQIVDQYRLENAAYRQIEKDVLSQRRLLASRQVVPYTMSLDTTRSINSVFATTTPECTSATFHRQHGWWHKPFRRVATLLPLASAWILPNRLFPNRDSRTRIFLAPQQLGSFEALKLPFNATSKRIVCLESYLDSYVPYNIGWERQQGLWQAHAQRLQKDAEQLSSFGTKDGCDTLIMLQHNPVFTLGTASDESFIHGNEDGVIPVQRINRGGEVTYHGPGQLTVYPVFDLRQYNQDIHWYMRALEEVIIRALKRVGVHDAMRDEDTTGVWVRNQKVAAVGVHARKWITQHGLAINVTPESLAPFSRIVPCGLHGRSVGCVQQFCPDRTITVHDMADAVSLAFEEVFQIHLSPATDKPSGA